MAPVLVPVVVLLVAAGAPGRELAAAGRKCSLNRYADLDQQGMTRSVPVVAMPGSPKSQSW